MGRANAKQGKLISLPNYLDSYRWRQIKQDQETARRVTCSRHAKKLAGTACLSGKGRVHPHMWRPRPSRQSLRWAARARKRPRPSFSSHSAPQGPEENNCRARSRVPYLARPSLTGTAVAAEPGRAPGPANPSADSTGPRCYRQRHLPASPSRRRGAGSGSSCPAGTGSSARTCSSSWAILKTTRGRLSPGSRGRAGRSAGPAAAGRPYLLLLPRLPWRGPAEPRRSSAGGDWLPRAEREAERRGLRFSAFTATSRRRRRSRRRSAAASMAPPAATKGSARRFRPARGSASAAEAAGTAPGRFCACARAVENEDPVAMATAAAAAMIPPPDSLLRYNPPVLVTRRTEKRSPGVSGAGPDGAPAGYPPPGTYRAPLSLSLSAGPPAEGDPAAARPDGARPAAPDGRRRRRVREAAAGAPQRHPAAAVSGAGPGPAPARQSPTGPAGGHPVRPGAVS